MGSLTLADAIEGLTGHRPEAAHPIRQVVIDSRQARPDSLFVALPGQQTDGHLFVQEAFERGAIAAITARPVAGCANFRLGHPVRPPLCIQVEDSLAGLQQLAAYWRSRFQPRVIGITGSVGKSTTKEITWAILSSRYHTLKSEGNFNNEIGLPLTLLQLNDDHQSVVLEMGMYDLGEISLLCRLARPQIGVVTNVGPTHLERLGTIERIVQAKTELVQALPAEGTAILNYDDPLVRPMAAHTPARVVTYGLSPEADLWASDVTGAGLEGIRFVFHYQGEETHARVPLLGRHSVHTALRAALVGLVEGLDWADIIAGLQTLPSEAQLRLVAVPGPNDCILLDDTYNASPASTLAALNLLDDLPAARKIAVLGDMLELGSYEEEGHRKVGCRAADIVDVLITIGSRARFIGEEALACGLAATAVLELRDIETAGEYLQKTVEAGDIVLIKGSNLLRLNELVSFLAQEGDVDFSK